MTIEKCIYLKKKKLTRICILVNICSVLYKLEINKFK